MTSPIKRFIAGVVPRMHALGTPVVVVIAGVDYAVPSTHDYRQSIGEQGEIRTSEEVVVAKADLPPMPFAVEAIVVDGVRKRALKIQDLGAKVLFVLTEKPVGDRHRT